MIKKVIKWDLPLHKISYKINVHSDENRLQLTPKTSCQWTSLHDSASNCRQKPSSLSLHLNTFVLSSIIQYITMAHDISR